MYFVFTFVNVVAISNLQILHLLYIIQMAALSRSCVYVLYQQGIWHQGTVEEVNESIDGFTYYLNSEGFYYKKQHQYNSLVLTPRNKIPVSKPYVCTCTVN